MTFRTDNHVIGKYIGSDNIPMIIISKYRGIVGTATIHIKIDTKTTHIKNDGVRFSDLEPDMPFNFDLSLCSIHRVDLPAVVQTNNFGIVTQMHWFQHNRSHRCDGPASIWYRGTEIRSLAWYINGVNLTTEVNNWFKYKGSEYGIKLDWEEWTDDDKLIFKLAFGG